LTNPDGTDAWLVIIDRNGMAGTSDDIGAINTQWD
jgi:hypothetical protein